MLDSKAPRNERSSLQKHLNNEFIDPDLRQILSSLLQLNPYFRMAAIECIHNPYFDPIRKPKNEIIGENKIFLDIDRDEAFDYVNCYSALYEFEDYKNELKILCKT